MGYNNTNKNQKKPKKSSGKGTGVLLLSKLGNIKKEKLKIKELAKGN